MKCAAHLQPLTNVTNSMAPAQAAACCRRRAWELKPLRCHLIGNALQQDNTIQSVGPLQKFYLSHSKASEPLAPEPLMNIVMSVVGTYRGRIINQNGFGCRSCYANLLCKAQVLDTRVCTHGMPYHADGISSHC